MATKAHTEQPAGGKPQFPPFNKETFASQLFWLALVFVLLYVLMSRIALPRVGGIIAARSDQIAADLAEAQKLRDDSDKANAAYEKTLAEARGKAQALAAQTRDKLMAQFDERRKGLEAQLAGKLAEAEKTIEATKTKAMANVRGIAVDAASAIVERLIGSAPNEKAVADAVADVLKR